MKTRTCTQCGLEVMLDASAIVAWAYYCPPSAGRSPFIRYERMTDDKFRRAPWIETAIYAMGGD